MPLRTRRKIIKIISQDMFVKFVTKVVCPFRRTHFYTTANFTVRIILLKQHCRHCINQVKHNDLFIASFCPCTSHPIKIFGIPVHDAEQRISKMLTVQFLGIYWPVRIRTPSYTVSIPFHARAYGNFPLRRMEQQINANMMPKMLSGPFRGNKYNIFSYPFLFYTIL